MEFLIAGNSYIEIKSFYLVTIREVETCFRSFKMKNFNIDFFNLWHLVNTLWEYFCTIKFHNVGRYKAQSGHILVISTFFPTYFKYFLSIYWVSKLKFLHVYFNTYFRQIMNFLLQINLAILWWATFVSIFKSIFSYEVSCSKNFF